MVKETVLKTVGLASTGSNPTFGMFEENCKIIIGPVCTMYEISIYKSGQLLARSCDLQKERARRNALLKLA